MLTWVKLGNRVVCKDTDWDNTNTRPFSCNMPYLGQILTIRDIVLYGTDVCLRFEEVVNDIREYGKYGELELVFKIRHFRPIKDTSIDNFKSILKNIPKKELENV